MRVLIDAHTLIWAADQPLQLGKNAAVVLREPTNQLLLSASTLWEIAIKVGLNKLSLSLPYRQWMTRAMSELGLTILPIRLEHADLLVGLPLHHRDPFDRLLAASRQNQRYVTFQLFESSGGEEPGVIT